MSGEGGYFSRTYMRSGAPSSDSRKLRKRLATAYGTIFSGTSREIGEYIEINLGLDVLRMGVDHRYVSWDDIFSRISVEDILDIITATYRFIKSQEGRRRVTNASSFVNFVEKAFREEHVAYRVDEKGGVHPFVDIGFSAAFAQTLEGLSDARLAAARHYVEDAELRLLATQLDTRGAVRAIFDAAENLFKLICPGQTQLNKDSVRRVLAPAVEAALTGDSHEKRARAKLALGFEDWIDAGHFYRHEPGHADPTQPSIQFAVLYLSLGFGFVRFLAEVLAAVSSGAQELSK
jgi:hypothetical protein